MLAVLCSLFRLRIINFLEYTAFSFVFRISNVHLQVHILTYTLKNTHKEVTQDSLHGHILYLISIVVLLMSNICKYIGGFPFFLCFFLFEHFPTSYIVKYFLRKISLGKN